MIQVVTAIRRVFVQCLFPKCVIDMRSLICFLPDGVRNVGFYQRYAQKYWLAYFPGLSSYHRFIKLMTNVLIPIAAFMLILIVSLTLLFDLQIFQNSKCRRGLIHGVKMQSGGAAI
jgi:hypothetical protein